MKNKAKYLDDLSKEKKQILKDIKNMDIVLNDKNKIDEEYIKRNKDLPLEKKIFSKRVLTKNMIEERNNLTDYLKELNNKMNAKNFLKIQKELIYEDKYLELIETKDIEKAVFEKIVLLQKRVIKALKYKIKHVSTRENITRIIYEIRYFSQIPISMNENISQNSKLVKLFENVEYDAIQKAYELKDFKEISKNVNINFEILKYMFSLEVIKLEDVSLKLIKEKDEIFIQFYDDDIIDKKFRINIDLKKDDLKIKFNKKVRLFDL